MIQRSELLPGLVSIVIGAYNNWPDLEMTIESALHQSYQPVEVIVVDNSSTDATPEEIPRRFGDRVHYMRQPNKGPSSQRNAGLAVAHGEFIQFLDGDDVLAPNKIAKQVDVFRANPELDIVYGDVRMFQTMAGVANWTDAATQSEDDILTRSIAPEGMSARLINPIGVLFHRRTLEKVGPWDESMLFFEDDDYWLRAAWAGCCFGHCPGSPMGFYRRRLGQLTENTSAMAHGYEAFWVKALTYVTREPYRSLITPNLARSRFRLAVFKHQMSTREALAKLALARATSPKTVSVLAYAIGYAIIVLPGGTALVRSRWLRHLGRTLARLLLSSKERNLAGKGRSSGLQAERETQ